MFSLRKKMELTPDMLKHQEEIEALRRKSEEELAESVDLGNRLRNIREANHFVIDFRKALGGN